MFSSFTRLAQHKATVILGALAVIAAVAGVTLAALASGEERPAEPALGAPSPSAEPSASPSPSPEVAAPPSPSPQPRPSPSVTAAESPTAVSPAPTAPTTSASAVVPQPAPPPRDVPTSALLSAAALGAGWTVDDDRSGLEPWLFDPCDPTRYPTDDARTAERYRFLSSPSGFVNQQVAAYPEATVAAEAIAGFRRVLAACPRKSVALEVEAVTQHSAYAGEPAPGLGPDAMLVRRDITFSADLPPVVQYLALFRRGNAVSLITFDTHDRKATAAGALAVARPAYTALCHYEGGCD